MLYMLFLHFKTGFHAKPVGNLRFRIAEEGPDLPRLGDYLRKHLQVQPCHSLSDLDKWTTIVHRVVAQRWQLVVSL